MSKNSLRRAALPLLILTSSLACQSAPTQPQQTTAEAIGPYLRVDMTFIG